MLKRTQFLANIHISRNKSKQVIRENYEANNGFQFVVTEAEVNSLQKSVQTLYYVSSHLNCPHC